MPKSVERGRCADAGDSFAASTRIPAGPSSGARAPMKRASYRHAVRWIADNDEPTIRDPEHIAYLVSSLLIADIFDVEPRRVGRDVARRRLWGP